MYDKNSIYIIEGIRMPVLEWASYLKIRPETMLRILNNTEEGETSKRLEALFLHKTTADKFESKRKPWGEMRPEEIHKIWHKKCRHCRYQGKLEGHVCCNYIGVMNVRRGVDPRDCTYYMKDQEKRGANDE